MTTKETLSLVRILDNRAPLISYLSSGTKTVSDVQKHFGYKENHQASNNIRQLEKYNLVKKSQQGIYVYCTLNKKELSRITGIIDKL